MAESLALAASIVGIIIPTLHCTRLLLDDIIKIKDAPAVVDSLKDDLTALQVTLESVRAIEEAQWQLLGVTVATHATDVITNCDKACRTFHGDLQRWTRRSQGGKLSWRDRANIGFFKERQVEAMAQQLQSCKLTCSNVLEVATLYSSMRNNRLTEETKDALTKQETEITVFSQATNVRLAHVEASLAELQLVDTTNQDEGTTDDLMSAETQLEQELHALKTSQELTLELLSRVSRDVVEGVARNGESSITTVTFGNDNSGVQMGVNYGAIGGIQLGKK